MASIILSTAGSAIGGSVGGPIGAYIGKAIGSAIGGTIDNKIFGPRRLADYEGARLTDLSVQSSAYGKVIPIIYGNMRLAGNVIWSLPIKETVSTKTASGGGKGGGGKVVQKQTTYSYSVTLAIAICEGEIDDIIRVWADAEVVNPALGTYRMYKGTETQSPDPLIESYEGVGATPAYRGLAYVVMEDFPLEHYGNRIPNFTFEVKRKIQPEADVTSKIKGITMIPASGEFAYDTIIQKKIDGEEVEGSFIQRGKQQEINQNSHLGEADAIVSLNQMATELPNIEWVSVVVGWFGNSLDAGDCIIKPAVEYVTGGDTTPDQWSVGSFNRGTAHAITHIDDRPIYGGTPSDASIVRYVTTLRERGYKIMFYPFIFMDVEGKPWRGRITGTSTEVADFFTKTNGYNAFVQHYAALLNGKVDAFCIGSELIGLTKVHDGAYNFTGVSALVDLAESVKTTLGSSVKVTYAADWSEYHHTTGGWYNLDPLWASSSIDVIGIDAYFPLTDAPQNGYDKQAIIDGWESGEGYDWYYTDEERTTKASLAPEYAWKNIEWFWLNEHINPNDIETDWVPMSKPVWFTEFGFPSVDGCANQPNVFYDPSSTESAFPRFSKGRVDFRAQSTAIEATLDKFADSEFVENMFLWTWDARPYPSFPEFDDVWSEGNQWVYGHWVNGKLGLSSIGSIISEINSRVGLESENLNFDDVFELVDGFVLDKIQPARAAVEALQRAYFFDVVEAGSKLKHITRGKKTPVIIALSELIPIKNKPINSKREHELLLPQKIDVNYLSRASDYQIGNQSSWREVTDSQGVEIINLPLALNDWQAKQIADISMFNIWLARTEFEFALPIKYAYLEPADLLQVDGHIIRITEILFGANGELRVKATAENNEVYDAYTKPNIGGRSNVLTDIADTKLEILDIPYPENEPKIRFASAAYGANWQGAAIFNSSDAGANYSQFSETLQEATVGICASTLPEGAFAIFDEISTLDVLLLNGELESVTEAAVLNGANAALVGSEIIQFRNATLLAENKYRISGLLRGRLGTEWAISTHIASERFILLDAAITAEVMPTSLIGLERSYKGVSLGKTLDSADSQNFTFNAVSLKPYAPVHITGERISGDLTISWIRRTRIGGELRDGADVPLNEEQEKYEIDIFDGTDVVRTITTTSTTAGYSATDQTADFGVPQSSITIKIYQISAIVGRGYAATAII